MGTWEEDMLGGHWRRMGSRMQEKGGEDKGGGHGRKTVSGRAHGCGGNSVAIVSSFSCCGRLC